MIDNPTHTLDIASRGQDKGCCSELCFRGQQFGSNFFNKISIPSGRQSRSTLFPISSD